MSKTNSEDAHIDYIVPNSHSFIIPKGIVLRKKRESEHFRNAMKALDDCLDREMSTEDIAVYRVTTDE